VLRNIFTPSNVIGLACLVGLVACGGPPERMQNPTKENGVAANSASEERLASEGKPKPAPEAAPEDPSQPYTVPIGGDPSAPPGTSAAGGTSKTGAKGGTKTTVAREPAAVPAATDPPAATKATGKVTRAECKQTFDKYVDLMSTDPHLAGIPPEMITQLKESAMSQAQAQKGDPCSTQQVTRHQYDCAMAASSTTAWERCMK
jgi:hypothetical protein